MKSRYIVTFTLIMLFTDSFFCETTKEPIDLISKTTSKEPTLTKPPLPEIASDSNGKQRWVQGLPNLQRLQSNEKNPLGIRKVTRLTKSLHYGFDPYFNKGYFEPFETRRKPITLVAFRKNGFAPRKAPKDKDIASNSDVAELQSPYNLVSNFWADIDENLPFN